MKFFLIEKVKSFVEKIIVEINKRTVRNKDIQVRKNVKINKRTCTTIPHFRVLDSNKAKRL